ncbi:MAG TPA: catalase family peroxidase [Candidatus Acidoferrales bacterium]|nr:catalase family peroxidase [Candidatus Acidoferrales bacterium]
MPLPSDQKLVQLGLDLLAQFDTIFGLHPGFRPAHAKGVLLAGQFTPARDAAGLTRAPHAKPPSTPVTVRFSDSTGLPMIPDNDPNAKPTGMATRFHLGERAHTDIVAHSTDGFPTRTGQEFLEFLRAVAASQGGKESPSPIEKFLGTHPAALAFVQAPKPSPASFASEQYFGVTALRFVNAGGEARYGRFRIVPAAGVEHLNEAATKAKGANYLFEELAGRVGKGPIRFDIQVQMAGPGDKVDDATIHWPAERPVIPFGKLELTATVPNDAQDQQRVIFDPIPRVDGIEPSEDPLLELRAAIYLLSGRRRREAPATKAQTA